MPRSWPALDVHFPAGREADRDEFSGSLMALLDGCGLTAVQESDEGWRLFFTAPEERDRALALLAASHPALQPAPIDVSDEDWARRSQEGLGAVRVGSICLRPPWVASDPSASSTIDLVIQPSMGFGTGHHASTRLCAALLQRLRLAGRSVVDVGTGSGVLALVAHRLGAATVVGVDDDGDALQAARENLDLNGAGELVELRQTDFRSLSGERFDVVIANLTGGLLSRGADTLCGLAGDPGVLILSGITVEEEASVRASFEPRLSLAARLEEEGWIGLCYSAIG